VVEVLKKNLNTELNAFPLDVFDGCFVQLNKRCKKCVAITGDILKESLRKTFI